MTGEHGNNWDKIHLKGHNKVMSPEYDTLNGCMGFVADGLWLTSLLVIVKRCTVYLSPSIDCKEDALSMIEEVTSKCIRSVYKEEGWRLSLLCYLYKSQMQPLKVHCVLVTRNCSLYFYPFLTYSQVWCFKWLNSIFPLCFILPAQIQFFLLFVGDAFALCNASFKILDY